MAKQTHRPKPPKPEMLPALGHLESLIRGNGDVTLGRAASIECAATAADEDQCLAMLVRRDGETLVQLLIRLDKAIELAQEGDRFIDEVNNGPDYSI